MQSNFDFQITNFQMAHEYIFVVGKATTPSSIDILPGQLVSLLAPHFQIRSDSTPMLLRLYRMDHPEQRSMPEAFKFVSQIVECEFLYDLRVLSAD